MEVKKPAFTWVDSLFMLLANPARDAQEAQNLDHFLGMLPELMQQQQQQQQQQMQVQVQVQLARSPHDLGSRGLIMQNMVQMQELYAQHLLMQQFPQQPMMGVMTPEALQEQHPEEASIRARILPCADGGDHVH